MKIKAVCELTGLTDRTIRYYIEEKLIFPLFTENYLGRKTYSFSEKDIKDLNHIAVLRKFDFTLDEIKSVSKDAETSKKILSNVKCRTEQAVANSQSKLTVLSQISAEKAYTVAELAEELSKFSLEIPIHKETVKTNILKMVWSVLKAILIFAIVWFPIALSLFVVIASVNDYHYPVFDPEMISLTIISLLPSIVVMFLPKTERKWKKIVQRILLVLCVLSIPVSFLMSFGIVSKSRTTDIINYRYFDANCLANRNIVFQEVFPIWPNYTGEYYYHYMEFLDYTYDIYAQWPLEEEKYVKEVERVAGVFSKYAEEKIYYYEFAELKKGDYNCLVLYYGDEPFSAVTDSYTYIIFAHNDMTKTVRYIYCDSLENGADQPYYLELEW